MVIGKVSTHSPCTHNPARLRRGSERAAAPDAPLSPGAISNVSQNLEPHPLTLTHKSKVTEEVPSPRGEGTDKKKKIQGTTLSPAKPGCRWALHPSSIPCPPTPASPGGKEGSLDLEPALGGR